MNMTDMKVSTRLTLGFGIVLTLLIAVAGSGYRNLTALHDNVQTLADDSVPKLIAVAGWEISVLQSARHMRNVLILDDKEGVAKEIASLADERKIRKEFMERLTSSVKSEAGRIALKEVVDARAVYVVEEDTFMKQASAGDLVAAKKTLLDHARPLQLKYISAIEKFSVHERERTETANKEAEATFASGLTMTFALAAIAIGMGVSVAVWITRSIKRQLGAEPAEATDLARNVANGDLSVPINLRAGDSSSLMAQLKAMQESLAKVVSNVRQNSESVATASAQIAQGNNDLSSRTEEQASALQETAASMEQLSSTVKQNADNAKKANQLALSASTVAVKGGEVVSEVVATMKGINDSSKKIADIISVIDGIAFQTNILALNAAVEAARAGEQGRGFAVVASEVRSLASRSADAAKEIKTLIGASVDRVEQGTALVGQAGVTMTEVVNAIRRVTDIMGEISAASTEQSSGVAQIGEAVSQMDQATQQNAALVEESAAAAESLKGQAQQLVSAVAVFKLVSGGSFGAPGYAAAISSASSLGRTEKLVIERLGTHRAKNVVRPGLNGPETSTRRGLPVSAPASVTPATSNTDAWEAF
jgi:methyl-accepting chemotaxis protein